MTYAIMSDADYKGICDTVREKTETSALLKSAEVAPAIRSIELGGTSLMLTVTTEAGATVTATKGSLSVTAVATDGTATLKLKEAGEWTVTATLNGETSTVVVSVSDSYELSLSYAVEVDYTGTYTDEIVTMSDGNYRLLTLTGSGVLTLSAPTECDIWLCGGGAGPKRIALKPSGGGGGGYCATLLGRVIQTIVVSVGVGGAESEGGETAISGDLSLSVQGGKLSLSAGSNGGDGGSGGGASSNSATATAGNGSGETTRPFKDIAQNPLCAGGAGGGQSTGTSAYGGDGGSDGDNGGLGRGDGEGKGGFYGGGDGGVYGGTTAEQSGKDATAYGDGGGGRARQSSVSTSVSCGAGYQGCVMIRIPA